MTASGCAANGKELHRFFDVAELGRVRHQVGDGRPAVGPRHTADGRDPERDAQLDRPAGAGHRRVRREGPGLAQVGRRPRAGLDRRQHAARSTPTSRPPCARADAFDAVVGVEVNISCPNVANRGLVFACDPLASAKVVALVREQLPARHPDLRQAQPGRHRHRRRSPQACVKAGADGLTMINTLLGMVIDTDLMRPQLGRGHRRAVRSGDPAGRGPRHLAGARRDARGPAADGADHRGRGSAHRARRPGAGRGRSERRPGRHGDLQRPHAPRCGSSASSRRCCADKGFARFTDAVGVAHTDGWTRADERPTMSDRSAPGCTRAMAAHGPLCVGHRPAPRRCSSAWGLPDDRRRAWRRFAMTCVEAFAGDGGRGQAAVGVLRALRLGRGRGPRARARRAARRRHAVAARRQARRHRLDDGGVRPGLPRPGQPAARPTRSPSAPTSATSRCVRRSTSPRDTGRGVFVLALTSNPEGARCSTPGGATIASPASVVAGAAADNAGARPGRARAASGSSSARRSARRAGPRARPGRRPRPAAGSRHRRAGRDGRGPAARSSARPLPSRAGQQQP